jgi:hypothetical protein
MKKLTVLILYLVSTNVFAWNILGPKNYDECILENMRGVTSDIGARLVEKSCREKFKEKPDDNSQSISLNKNPKLSERCDVYWNGRGFLKGNVSSNSDFTMMAVSRYGVDIINLGIPKAMYKELELGKHENMFDSSYAGGRFFSKNFQKIVDLCGIQ